MLDRSGSSPLVDERRELLGRTRVLARIAEAEAPRADAEAAVTPATWAALADSGLLLAPFPRSLNGDDLGSVEGVEALVAILRCLGGADLSMARLYEGHVNAILLVRRYGTPDQLEALAEAVSAGGLSGVWGAEGETPLALMPAGSGWLLQGGKRLASGAGFLTHPLVPANTDAGQVLVMPSLKAGERADLSEWTAQGMRSSATGSIDLTGLPIGRGAMIGQPGDFTRQPFFSGGAWRFCAVHLGAAERLGDLLRSTLVDRGRGADPYQLQRLAQATIALTTARFWIAEAACRLADETAPAEMTVAFANLTRTVTERAALDVLELVHRGVGLSGFLRPSPIERISRDLATYLRQPVPDLAMADAARAVLAAPGHLADVWEGSAW